MSSLSVIIPIYNQEKYIVGCLDSVSRQSFTDYEIICIDDGSTDNSAKIIQDCMQSDGRIRYEYQENRGAGPARNKGIELAKGDYIAFLDPDDLLPDNNVYRDLISAADKRNASIVGGSLLALMGDKLYSPCSSRLFFSSEGWIDYVDFQEYAFYTRYIYNRSMLDEGGIRFPSFRRFQDPPFMIESMLAAGAFFSISRPAYAYRIGHKPIVYSDEKLVDYLSGIERCLNLTSGAKLKKAHRSLVEVFGNEPYIARSLPVFRNSPVISQAIDGVLNSIDWSLIDSDSDNVWLPLVEYKNSLENDDVTKACRLGLFFAIKRARAQFTQSLRFLRYRRYTQGVC